MWVCEKCGQENVGGRSHCGNCGTPKDETTAKGERGKSYGDRVAADELQISPIVPASKGGYINSIGPFVYALKVCAWVALAAGIVGCFLVLSSAPEDVSALNSLRIQDKDILKSLRAQAITTAVVIAVQGFVVWVLFNALAAIADNVEFIRHKISSNSKGL